VVKRQGQAGIAEPLLLGRGAQRKVEADERARGAVRERATRAAGSRARSRPGWSGGAVEWAARCGPSANWAEGVCRG